MTAPRRVLVVEDDHELRDTLGELLVDEGYESVCVEDGAAALEFLGRGPPYPALIVLDLMMPNMNGWRFRERQLADPAIADIPVVVLTAGRQIEAASLGAADIVYKPIQLDRFLGLVRRHAGGEP